jgi:hypothetical protein
MRQNLSNTSPEWVGAVFGANQIVIKILVVADGILNFIKGSSGFSLNLFCQVLKEAARPGEKIEVTTVHRETHKIEAEPTWRNPI